ncbi:alpha/beta fold hydrolase [Leifsonia psychrotolerans]|uniref:alpha/beta fold hydrolase n=1 Tax=Glaciibacter psychrotolerans TaxID=670054 RepID=UPI0031B59F27
MSPLPRSAFTPAPASLPPTALPGLDPAFSRLVDVPERDSKGQTTGLTRRWHVLDNAAELDRLGVEPVGTVLCVHGNPTWSYLWRRLVSAASTDAATEPGEAWRVIAVDQLEMGFSERTGRPRALEQRVRDLADFTAAIGLDGPVVTLGHDWGGVVSMGWAVDHPELLAGVMLLNTAIHQPEGTPIPAPLRLALRQGVLGVATVSTPAFLETTLALAHPSLPAEVKRGYRAPYRTAARRGGIGGFVADIPVDAGHESFAELDRIATGLRHIAVPALLLWGPRDPIFSDRYLDDLIERMPHADVHRFEGAGHLLAEDVDYASAVRAWLGDRRPAGGHSAVESVLSASAHPLVEPVETQHPAVESVLSASAHPLVEPVETQHPAVESVLSASAHPLVEPVETQFRPLWHYLDELNHSTETALIEMVPTAGAAPRVVSWRLLSTRVREIAAGLTRIGVKKGDRVSLLVQPGADLTAVLYACVRIGAIVVVADAGLGLTGLTRAVRGARPDHVIGALPGLVAARALGWPGQKISTVRLPSAVARALGISYVLADLAALGRKTSKNPDGEAMLPAPPLPDETAAILFTSGSTGPAKGVVYTHAQLSAVRDALAAQYGVGVGTGLVAGFAPFALLGPALGARSVTPDMNVTSPKTLTASAVAAAVAAVDATVVFLSPAAITNVVATADALTASDRRALEGVRTFLSAGAPVSERLLSAAARLMPGASAHTPYGMTEGLLLTDISLDGIRSASGRTADASGTAAELRTSHSTSDSTGVSAGTTAGDGPGGVCVGVPAATTRVRISALDEHGAATGEPGELPGVTGEIVISAPHIRDHYDRLWLTNRASVRGTSSDGRWHRTGDVGHLDSTGRLWVEGRLPHVITTADGVLTPVGPEQRIESLPGVARAAAVGVGPAGVQQLVAIVETEPSARRVGLASPGLAAAVRGSAGTPVAAVLVVPRLPTDIRHNSKIDRSRLARWADGILSGKRMTRP